MEVERLLGEVSNLLEIQNQLELAKKEKFNIFQVLKLSTNETRTHSAFIAELLNPNGSHLMGDIFLKDFVDNVLRDFEFEVNDCIVTVEKHIGPISEDYLKGGRLDIVISNIKGISITIENKIYAKLGKNQIQRYINHNKGSTLVVLLTLNDYDLEFDQDYGLMLRKITYRTEVLDWLERCHILSMNYPALQESIKQYMKLIEHLVGKLNGEKMNKQLCEIIINNIEASRTIAANYDLVLNQVRIGFQQQVFDTLSKKDFHNFEIEIGREADQSNSQIWIIPKGYREIKKLWFGIEGFSGRGNFNGQLIMGIISISLDVSHSEFSKVIPNSNLKGWWFDLVELKDQLGQSVIDFSNDHFVAKLAIDSEYRNGLIEEIVQNFENYWKAYSMRIIEILN